jgi:hypothetical protein
MVTTETYHRGSWVIDLSWATNVGGGMKRSLTAVVLGCLAVAGCADSSSRVGPAAASGNTPESTAAGEQVPTSTDDMKPTTTAESETTVPASGAPPSTTGLPALEVPTEGSGVVGRMVTWPRCPAEPTPGGCAPQPVSGQVVLSLRSGDRVSDTEAAADGSFRIAVPAGDYTVNVNAEGTMCSPVDVTVTADRYTQVEVRCDAGVR